MSLLMSSPRGFVFVVLPYALLSAMHAPVLCHYCASGHKWLSIFLWLFCTSTMHAQPCLTLTHVLLWRAP